MTTDDERREVAENLRTMCAYGVRYKEQFYELLEEVVMDVEDFHEFSDVADRLADLIDPDCEEGRYEGVHTARPVDREALLALAEEMQGYADVAASCDGSPYVNAGALWGYADRIREACGEVGA